MKNKTSALLALTAAVGLVSSAYAADEATGNATVKYHSDGGYDSSSSGSQTDAAGTTTSVKNKADVSVDSKGKTTRKVKHHATKDPKGLGNKKTSDTDAKYQEKDNGGYKASSTTTNTDAAGTNTTSKMTKDVDVDSKGNVTNTETTKTTTDPKGMMNKTTENHTTKTVNGEVVEDK